MFKRKGGGVNGFLNNDKKLHFSCTEASLTVSANCSTQVDLLGSQVPQIVDTTLALSIMVWVWSYFLKILTKSPYQYVFHGPIQGDRGDLGGVPGWWELLSDCYRGGGSGELLKELCAHPLLWCFLSSPKRAGHVQCIFLSILMHSVTGSFPGQWNN